MSEQHFFASANTGIGFVNFFENINPNNDGFTYVLKGGSGTGKSTLMKKIGNHFLQKGLDVEFFHCSSDPNSLDGIRIVKQNLAIVDGTSPHVTEAVLPEIKDRIVNVGAFINSKVAEHKTEIETFLAEKKYYYKNVYNYFSSAKKLYDINFEISKKATNFDLIKAETNLFFKKYSFKNTNKPGFERKLFLSAVDKNCTQNYADANNYKNKYLIAFNNFENAKIMENIALNTIQKGYDIITFFNLYNPQIIDAIFIPSKQLFIHTKNTFASKTFLQNQNFINTITKKIGNSLADARKNHQKIEKFYIKNMDFKSLTVLTNNLIYELDKKTSLKF